VLLHALAVKESSEEVNGVGFTHPQGDEIPESLLDWCQFLDMQPEGMDPGTSIENLKPK
jgi:hypothetical protein